VTNGNGVRIQFVPGGETTHCNEGDAQSPTLHDCFDPRRKWKFRRLTNEVQRRAKRVRCNAGLGCWCPQAACSLCSPGLSGAASPCAVRDPDDCASADAREGADVGTTNLERLPLRVEALVVGAPWLRNKGTARRWCWWLRARIPRPAGTSDAADMPTAPPNEVRVRVTRWNALERRARA